MQELTKKNKKKGKAQLTILINCETGLQEGKLFEHE